MMGRRAAVLVIALSVVGPGGLLAQSGRELVTRGVAAYRALDLNMAQQLFQEALAARGPDALPEQSRAGVHVYLGAIALLRGRDGAAAAEFDRALEIDPFFEPDPLVFPPNLLGPFEALRRRTRYVQVRAARDTTIVAGLDSLRVRLAVSAPHEVAVDLLAGDGTTMRRLYSGWVSDSIGVTWNGLDAEGAPAAGSVVMQISSAMPDGGARIVRLPMTVQPLWTDSVPAPAPPPESLFQPESRGAGGAVRSAAVGIVAGLAVVLLPEFVGEDGGASGRYVVGGALGAAGLIGFLTRQPGRRIPENVAANQALREKWESDVAEIRAENERRRRHVRLAIKLGEHTVVRTGK